MKTKTVICALICALAITGCSQDEPCTGTIDIVNFSDDAYEIYIDGKFHSKTWGSIHLGTEKGHHTVKAIQLTGYLLFPTEYFFEFDLNCGEYKYIKFPE